MHIDEVNLNATKAPIEENISSAPPRSGKAVDPKIAAFNDFYLKAHALYERGAVGSLETREHQFLLLIEVVASGSKFFNRIFQDNIGKSTNAWTDKKTGWSHPAKTRYLTISELIGAKEKSALLRTIWLRALSLLTVECGEKKIPCHVFFNNTISYDNGATIHYFGAGVPIVCEVLRANGAGEWPKIQVSEDYKLIVDSSVVSKLSTKNSNDKFTIESSKNVECVTGSECCTDEKYVAIELGTSQHFYAISGSFTSTGRDGSYVTEVLYNVPYPIRQGAGGKAHKALATFPKEFLKRKLRNLCYKIAFMDAINIEVTEEYHQAGLHNATGASAAIKPADGDSAKLLEKPTSSVDEVLERMDYKPKFITVYK